MSDPAILPHIPVPRLPVALRIKLKTLSGACLALGDATPACPQPHLLFALGLGHTGHLSDPSNKARWFPPLGLVLAAPAACDPLPGVLPTASSLSSGPASPNPTDPTPRSLTATSCDPCWHLYFTETISLICVCVCTRVQALTHTDCLPPLEPKPHKIRKLVCLGFCSAQCLQRHRVSNQ